MHVHVFVTLFLGQSIQVQYVSFENDRWSSEDSLSHPDITSRWSWPDTVRKAGTEKKFSSSSFFGPDGCGKSRGFDVSSNVINPSVHIRDLSDNYTTEVTPRVNHRHAGFSDGPLWTNYSFWMTLFSVLYALGQPVKQIGVHESLTFPTRPCTAIVGYCSHCLLQSVNEKQLNWTKVQLLRALKQHLVNKEQKSHEISSQTHFSNYSNTSWMYM